MTHFALRLLYFATLATWTCQGKEPAALQSSSGTKPRPGQPHAEDYAKVLWSPERTSIACNTRELHYTHLTLFHYSAAKNRFVEMNHPDLITLTGGRVKSVEELQPRTCVEALRWDNDETLVLHVGVMYRGPAGEELNLETKLRLKDGEFMVTKTKEIPPQGKSDPK